MKIFNIQIVNGEIPAELLNKIRAGVEELDLSGCFYLTTMPDLPTSLRKLNLDGCSRLNTLPANLPPDFLACAPTILKNLQNTRALSSPLKGLHPYNFAK